MKIVGFIAISAGLWLLGWLLPEPELTEADYHVQREARRIDEEVWR